MRISLATPTALPSACAAGRRRPARHAERSLPPVLTPRAGLAATKGAGVAAAEPLLDFVQDLIAATRSAAGSCRAEPRAGIALVRRQGAQALLAGRDYVAPDDVQAILPQTIAHRLVPHRRRRPRTGGAGARDDRLRAAAVNPWPDSTAQR